MQLTFTPAFSACAAVYSLYISSLSTVVVCSLKFAAPISLKIYIYIQLCTPAGGPNWNIEGETASPLPCSYIETVCLHAWCHDSLVDVVNIRGSCCYDPHLNGTLHMPFSRHLVFDHYGMALILVALDSFDVSSPAVSSVIRHAGMTEHHGSVIISDTFPVFMFMHFCKKNHLHIVWSCISVAAKEMLHFLFSSYI